MRLSSSLVSPVYVLLLSQTILADAFLFGGGSGGFGAGGGRGCCCCCCCGCGGGGGGAVVVSCGGGGCGGNYGGGGKGGCGGGGCSSGSYGGGSCGCCGGNGGCSGSGCGCGSYGGNSAGCGCCNGGGYGGGGIYSPSCGGGGYGGSEGGGGGYAQASPSDGQAKYAVKPIEHPHAGYVQASAYAQPDSAGSGYVQPHVEGYSQPSGPAASAPVPAVQPSSPHHDEQPAYQASPVPALTVAAPVPETADEHTVPHEPAAGSQHVVGASPYKALASKTTANGVGNGKCNSAELRAIMEEQMVGEDANESKRRVHKAANGAQAVQVQNGEAPAFDVVCAPSAFSYRIATDLYCEHTKAGVTCFAYQQQ